MSAEYNLDKEIVKEMAVKLCQAKGLDPYEKVGYNGGQYGYDTYGIVEQWVNYQEKVEDFLLLQQLSYDVHFEKLFV